MMLFLHLFNQEKNVDLCTTFLCFNGYPLVYKLSEFTGICVSMYLFMSGYGLFVAGKRNDKTSDFKRIGLLYVNFWIIFTLFIGLACYLKPDKYPGSWCVFINNITAWNTTYNSEWWFLFPYMVLALLSPSVMRLIRKYSSIKIFFILGVIYLLSFTIMKLNLSYLHDHRNVYMPILSMNLLFSFGAGAIFAKEKLFDKFDRLFVKLLKLKNIILSATIFLMIIARMLIPYSVFNSFFAFTFMLCFISLQRPFWLDSFLTKMGEHSTNMWLIHSFFCYYLFHDFVYGFRYPVVIFIVLLLLSYVSSCIVNGIYKPIQQRIKNTM